jgi:hypothetical protein
MTAATPGRAVSRWVIGTAITGTIVIALGAFWLSFTALRHLAIRSGIPAAQAWAWPLIVDGIIVVATCAVVALAGKPNAWYPWLLLAAGAAVSVTANAVQAAIEPTEVPPVMAAAVAAVPPVVLLAITHLTVVLTRQTRTVPGAVTAKADDAVPATTVREPVGVEVQRRGSLPGVDPRQLSSASAVAEISSIPAADRGRGSSVAVDPLFRPAEILAGDGGARGAEPHPNHDQSEPGSGIGPRMGTTNTRSALGGPVVVLSADDDAARVAEARRMQGDGKSLTAIGAHFHVHRSTVARWLSKDQPANPTESSEEIS